ncbi:MAG TPA: tetratricopeptide repeat protein [bacterium]|nr:tetratricopeptide repeat protein [bacterium]
MHKRNFLGLLLLLSLLVACAGMQKQAPAPYDPYAGLSENEQMELQARVAYHVSQGYLALEEGNAATAVAHFDMLEELGVIIPEVQIVKAMIYIQGSAIDRAMLALDRSLEAYPDHVDTLFLKAGILAAQFKYDEAAELYQRILELRPDHEQAAIFLAALYEEKGEMRKMRRLLEDFTKENPQAARAWYELGRVYLREENWSAAKKAFLAATQGEAENVKAWIGLAFACEELDRRDEAINAYQTALKLAPNDRVIRQQLIRLHLRSNDPDAAMEQVDKLEILGGGVDETLIARGAVLFYQGKPVDALAQFNLVLEKDPENHQARYFAAVCLARLNRIDEAMNAYRRIPADNPYYLDARIGLAYLLIRVNRAGDALAELDLLAEKFPGEVDVLRARATVMTEMGRFEQAEQALEEARKIAPQDKQVIYSLAVLYERSGRWKKAVQLMEQQLETDPNDADALNFVGYTLADHDAELEHAEELLRRVMTLKPNSGHVVDSYGWVLYKLKRYDEALQQLKRALELEPSEAVIAEHIGDVYAAQGDKENAVEYWRMALTLNPDQPTKKRIKEKLGE